MSCRTDEAAELIKTPTHYEASKSSDRHAVDISPSATHIP